MARSTNKKRTERAIADGWRAIRRGINPLARDVERAIIARGDPKLPLNPFDRRIIEITFNRIAREAFTGIDAPVKVAAAESILKAAGSPQLARRLLKQQNEYGKTLAQEINGAKNKILRRMKRELDEGIRRKRPRREVAKAISEIWEKHHALNRVIAWHTARAVNERNLAEIKADGGQFF